MEEGDERPEDLLVHTNKDKKMEGSEELVVMDYTPALKRPPIHNWDIYKSSLLLLIINTVTDMLLIHHKWSIELDFSWTITMKIQIKIWSDMLPMFSD